MYVCTHREMGFRETVCDSRYGGNNLAARCPLFESALQKDDIVEEFDSFWETASLPEFAERFPDAMALLWVLGEQDSRQISKELPGDEEDSLLNSLVDGSLTVSEVDDMVVIIPSGDDERVWSPFCTAEEIFDKIGWTENG